MKLDYSPTKQSTPHAVHSFTFCFLTCRTRSYSKVVNNHRRKRHADRVVHHLELERRQRRHVGRKLQSQPRGRHALARRFVAERAVEGRPGKYKLPRRGGAASKRNATLHAHSAACSERAAFAAQCTGRRTPWTWGRRPAWRQRWRRQEQRQKKEKKERPMGSPPLLQPAYWRAVIFEKVIPQAWAYW